MHANVHCPGCGKAFCMTESTAVFCICKTIFVLSEGKPKIVETNEEALDYVRTTSKT